MVGEALAAAVAVAVVVAVLILGCPGGVSWTLGMQELRNTPFPKKTKVKNPHNLATLAVTLTPSPSYYSNPYLILTLAVTLTPECLPRLGQGPESLQIGCEASGSGFTCYTLLLSGLQGNLSSEQA